MHNIDRERAAIGKALAAQILKAYIHGGVCERIAMQSIKRGGACRNIVRQREISLRCVFARECQSVEQQLTAAVSVGIFDTYDHA